jgi:hypothetical protein
MRGTGANLMGLGQLDFEGKDKQVQYLKRPPGEESHKFRIVIMLKRTNLDLWVEEHQSQVALTVIYIHIEGPARDDE